MKQKILAIDDSLTLREFIQRSLVRQSADYVIILAKDGTEGLALAASEQPDLILLDFILPDMKGDEVCRQLQSDKRTAGLPVVLMSSSAADIKRTQSEFENVIKAIAKPFTPDLLCSTVAHSLRETSAENSRAAPRRFRHAARHPRRPQTDLPLPPSCLQPPNAERQICQEIPASSRSSPYCWRWSRINSPVVLRLTADHGKPLDLYVVAGRPVLVTLRDPATYLRNSGYKLTPEQIQAAGEIGGEQTLTGSPIFMQFAEAQADVARRSRRDLPATEPAVVRPVWTTPRTHFNFEPMLPCPR